MAVALIQSYLHSSHWTFEQLRDKSLAQGPSNGSLAVLGCELATFRSEVKHLNHWATTALLSTIKVILPVEHVTYYYNIIFQIFCICKCVQVTGSSEWCGTLIQACDVKCIYTLMQNEYDLWSISPIIFVTLVYAVMMV